MWESIKTKNSCIFPYHLYLYIRCGFFQTRKLLEKKIDFVKIFYISKYVKKIETITCGKVLKYLLAFDEESKRKLLNFVSVGSFINNNNIYDFGVKTSIIHA